MDEGDPGPLPSAEEGMRQTWCPEKRQVIYVAESKRMTLIEVRTGSVGFEIVRIRNRKVAARGRIIDRVAKGVRQIKQQRAYRFA